MRFVLASIGLTFAAAAQNAAPKAEQIPAPNPAFEAAKRALSEGHATEAAKHGLVALEVDPTSTDVLTVLLEAAGDDGDAKALWSHALVAAASDEKGKNKLDHKVTQLFPAKDASILALEAARVSAADELAELVAGLRKSADKNPEGVLTLQWAAELGRAIARESPALAKQHASVFAPGFPLLSKCERDVVGALQAQLAGARGSGRTSDAIDFALVLRGLGAQANFKDLEGPKAPKLDDAWGEANVALNDARQELAKSAVPLSVEQLDALDGEQRDKFTRDHASFVSPGVAISPKSWYRVETICGYATLLGVTETVELHHARLAKWYGKDPFVGRPGVVRVVPEASGLESEGAPFWWAGGFQAGDITSLRFSCGTIEGFGHGLTHELTHRFDGALYPGQPAWLAEGKAVWTGAAFGNSDDPDFVDDHASFGTIEDASIRGYGARENLEKLVTGTIEDYRDNYVAGYALYVYLKSWSDEGAPPKYAKKLVQFMETRARDKRPPLEAFVAHFADGKEGRPKDMQAFADDFGKWAGGFYWRDIKPWTKRYTQDVGKVRASDFVLDEPTWVWSRSRAEPWFGQDQARAAGELLLKRGDESNAFKALAWSLGVDERWESVDRSLLALCKKLGEQQDAWIVANALARRGLAVEKGPANAPILARLAKTRGLLDEYRSTIASYVEQGHAFAAAALAADHDVLAARVGLPVLSPTIAAPKLDGNAANALHPFDEPRRSLMPSGWIEDGLTDYERHRVKGAWCVDAQQNLHVGRAQPRIGTGTTDRQANQHDAFVHSQMWLDAGRYSIKARITPTTSYVSGAIVLGYTRRDRNVRLHFTAGDFLFSIGDKPEAADLDKVGWSLEGKRERDYALPGATGGGEFAFSQTVSGFEFELLVDGGAVHVYIDGKFVATYHTADGLPLEGFVGFAVSFGDIKVQGPSVQRLDRSAAFHARATFPEPLDIAAPRPADFKNLLDRRVLGLPLARQGTLCLWMPMPDREADGSFDAQRAAKRFGERAFDFQIALERLGLGLPAALALPAALGADAVASAKAAMLAQAPELCGRAQIVLHGPADGAAGESTDASDAHQTWLLFLDSTGVLRAAETFYSGKQLEGGLRRWIDVFRNR
jgi:hypothetical protein